MSLNMYLGAEGAFAVGSAHRIEDMMCALSTVDAETASNLRNSNDSGSVGNLQVIHT